MCCQMTRFVCNVYDYYVLIKRLPRELNIDDMIWGSVLVFNVMKNETLKLSELKYSNFSKNNSTLFLEKNRSVHFSVNAHVLP